MRRLRCVAAVVSVCSVADALINAEPTAAIPVDADTDAYCDRVLNLTGGPLHIPHDLWYSDVQTKEQTGVVQRRSSCELLIEQRGLAKVGMPFTVSNQSAVVEARGRHGMVISLVNPTDPLGKAVCGVSGLSHTVVLPAEDIHAAGHGLPDDGAVKTGVFPGAVCPHRFYHAPGVAGSTFELAREPHTEELVQRLPSDVRKRWTSVSWKWCAPPSVSASYARACGYSANVFPEFSVGHAFAVGSWERQAQITYPSLAKPVGVYVAASDRPKVVKKAKQSTPTVRYRHLFVIHSEDSADLNAAQQTAVNMGWSVSADHSSISTAKCKTVSNTPVMFTGRAKFRKLLRYNVGHWLQDVHFYLFSTIHNKLPLLKGHNYTTPDYELVMPPLQWELVWSVMAHNANAPDLIESLAPKRIVPVPGTCYTNAYFDCPVANSMGPVRPWQDWLTYRHGWSFTPSPVRDRPPRLMLLIRQRGSDRFMSNWRKLAALARDSGWDLDVPLPEEKGRSIGAAGGQLLSKWARYQRTDVAVSMHGAELAAAPFMRNGTVTVEILPTGMKLTDLWYVKMAQASGLHHMRWILPHKYMHWYGSPPLPGSAVPQRCRLDPICMRTTRSDVTIPPAEWVQLLTFLRHFLGVPASDSTRPRDPKCSA
eukprot:TRINITY_DN10861_c0_g4_i1.p1 TRINITY_DN10861_c0_g4~~TRINITY_DN10861_c0_g4_i1.p1  ORF type:complete len:650 (+),score=41.87 TRINITY_DN10861_c0_g4_i1:140-2089(+)